MLRTILFATVFFFVSISVSAQVISIKNGISLSSINAEKIDILDNRVTNYAVSVGLDYWENENYYLSSEIGYLKKGGSEENSLLSDSYSEITEDWDFLHLNTTFRYRFNSQKSDHFFLGLGPKVDFLMGSSEFDSDLFDGFDLESTIFGAKAELGFVKDLGKIRTGVTLSYLYDISKAGSTEFINFKNNAYSALFSIGYRL